MIASNATLIISDVAREATIYASLIIEIQIKRAKKKKNILLNLFGSHQWSFKFYIYLKILVDKVVGMTMKPKA